MNVLFITLFSEISGSSRVIVYQFLPFFAEAGIKYQTRIVYPNAFFKIQMGVVHASKLVKQANFIFYLFLGLIKRFFYALEAKNYDVIFIQRDVFPKTLYWFLRKMNPRVIYEFEDTFSHANPFLKRNFLRSLLLHYQRKLYKNMVQKAAHVVAVNEYVADEAKEVNKNVSVICEPINTDFFKPKEETKTSNAVTMGWIGSPSTTIFLKSIVPVFKELGNRFTNVQLKLVGAAADFFVDGISFAKKEWHKEDELKDLQSFDIGLMPLDDDPFYRGHLGHKMIQYMCVGIPTVASNAGLNPIVIKDGVNGFLVSSGKEWVAKLSMLIENEQLRYELGRNGRKIAEDVFSLKKLSNVFISILKNTARI